MSESFVWKYFVKNQVQQSATCKKCKAEIKCKGWSTSGLIRHLHGKHNINKSSTSDSENKDEENVCSSNKRKASQQNLSSFLIKKNNLQEIVTKLSTLDGISINSITKSEFIRQSLAEKGYTLPKNPTHVIDLVHSQYKQIKEGLISKIAVEITSGTRFSISLDEYTSLNNRRYLNINVHIGEGKFWNLGMVRIAGSLPAEVAVNVVKEKLAEFHISLEKHVVACVTDGAAVMKKMGRLMECEHQLCYAHGIHLAVCDALYQKSPTHLTIAFSEENQPELDHQRDEYNIDESEEDFTQGIEVENVISEYEQSNEKLFEIDITTELYEIDVSQIINKVRKIAIIFRKSPVKNNVLQEYVKQDHGKQLHLMLDSKTRWNSLLAMLERYIKIRPSVLKALIDLKEDKNSTLSLERKEIDVIHDIVASLEPLTLAVEKLGRRESTLLLAEDITSFVLKELEQLNTTFSKKIHEYLFLRIKERRNEKLMGLLLYLTGGIKYKKCKSDSTFPVLPEEIIISSAKQMFDRLFGEPVISDSSEVNELQESQTVTLPTEMTLADKLNAYLEASEKSRIGQEHTAINKKSSSGEQLKIELEIFGKTGVKTQKISLLLTALKTLPPTSIESERAFSAAGLFVTKLRTRLSDQSIDHFCFLKSYYENL